MRTRIGMFSFSDILGIRLNRRPIVQGLIAILFGVLLATSTLFVGRLSFLTLVIIYGSIIGGLISLLVSDLRRWLIGLSIIDLSLLADVYPGYLPSFTFGTITGYVFSLTTVILIVVYAIWLVEAIATRKVPYRHPTLLAVGTLPVYFLGILISWTNAPIKQLVGFEAYMLVQCLLLLIYVAGSVRTREDVLFLIPFIAAALFIQAVIITIQRLGYVNPAVFYFEFAQPGRPGGAFGSPNVSGGFLSALITPLLASLFIPSVFKRWKFVFIPIIIFGLIALVLTQSRGGWIAFVTSVVILFPLAWWRKWLSTSVLFTTFTLVSLVLIAVSPIVIQRLTGDDGGSAESRGPLNEIALLMFDAQPFVGVGSNNFAVEIPSYLPPHLASEWLYTAHNRYLLILAETGIIGFVGWVSFLVITVVRGIIVWRYRDRVLSMMALGLTAAALGHYTHMLGESFNARPMIQLLWTYSALLFAMGRILREERDQNLLEVRR